MNLKTIKLLPSSLSVQICIGRMGEHGVTKVDFDLSEFENTYGSGTPELLFRPKNSSESYPVPLINDGGSNYKWIVNLPATAKSGSHVATMRWYVGEDLAKSCDIQCHVESVSDVVVGDMPDPVKDWLDNTAVADKKDKIIGTYGSSISNRVYEVIGIPEYIGEDEIGTVNGFNITTTGWYAFARITADNGVYVGSSLIVDGVEDYRAGVNYLDVAVRFGTNGESRAITVNWNGSVTNTYLISASDLAIRNLDYRSTYRVYDIGDCLSFTTSGTKKAVFQNLTRNIVYAVDAIDCPMVVHLPDVSTESYGTWIELRVELTTSKGVSLEFIPPEGTKLSGTNVNVPKEGLNIIMAQYHEKMNTWFISNTVWAKPK